MHDDIGNIGDVIDAAYKEKRSTSNTARLVGYKLPIKPGKITFSAIDPLGDTSRRPFKTSLVWGQSSNCGLYLPDKLLEVSQVTTMKFLPFKISYDGTIKGGGFFADQFKKLVCVKCKKEMQVSNNKYTAIKRNNKSYCQDCINKGVKKEACFLRYAGEIPGPVDKETIEEMCKQEYEGVTNPLGLIPQVYGVFKNGEAPGAAESMSWLEEEIELVNRYKAIGREIRPLKFLSDLYSGSGANGRRVWNAIPSLEDLIVHGTPVVTQWVSDKEIGQCPFSKGGRYRAGYSCKLPKPSIDLLV
jgi:hypothetical protein